MLFPIRMMFYQPANFARQFIFAEVAGFRITATLVFKKCLHPNLSHR